MLMTTSDADRNELYNALRDKLGLDQTSTLMSLLPPDGWRELATKDDVRLSAAEIRAELHTELGQVRGVLAEIKADVSELRGEFGGLRGEFGGLRGEFGELRGEFGELRGEFGELRGELRTEMAALESRITGAMRAQLIAIVATVATMQGITVAVLAG